MFLPNRYSAAFESGMIQQEQLQQQMKYFGFKFMLFIIKTDAIYL